MLTLDLDRLRTQADLFTIVGHDVALRPASRAKTNKEHFGPCPFCGKGDDRFHVLQADGQKPQRFFCRICGASGDVLTYVAKREGLDLTQADDLRRMAEILGAVDAQPARAHRLTPPALTPSGPPPEDWQRAAREVIKTCTANLWGANGERARLYLTNRGLTPDTLRRWQIGYLPGSPTEWRKMGGLSVPCGIVIPGEVGGVIWYLKTRRAKAEPRRKYPQVTGSRPALFGADTLTEREVVVMAEGEFDAMLLAQESGEVVGVCTMGSASGDLDLSQWGASLVHARRLLLAYDSDQAGANGAQRMAAMTQRARRIIPPMGKDVTEFWQAGGNLKEWIGFEMARLDLTASAYGEQVAGIGSNPATADPCADLERIWGAWWADPDPAREAEHKAAYASAAIVTGLPFYDLEGQDLGPAQWRKWGGLSLPIADQDAPTEEAWWAGVWAERGLPDPATVTEGEFKAAMGRKHGAQSEPPDPDPGAWDFVMGFGAEALSNGEGMATNGY